MKKCCVIINENDVINHCNYHYENNLGEQFHHWLFLPTPLLPQDPIFHNGSQFILCDCTQHLNIVSIPPNVMQHNDALFYTKIHYDTPLLWAKYISHSFSTSATNIPRSTILYSSARQTTILKYTSHYATSLHNAPQRTTMLHNTP